MKGFKASFYFASQKRSISFRLAALRDRGLVRRLTRSNTLLPLFQYFICFEALDELLGRNVYLLLGVGGHEREPDQRILGGAGRRNDRIHEHALLKQHLGDEECLVEIPYI